jgi:hypothetical protein
MNLAIFQGNSVFFQYMDLCILNYTHYSDNIPEAGRKKVIIFCLKIMIGKQIYFILKKTVLWAGA